MFQVIVNDHGDHLVLVNGKLVAISHQYSDGNESFYSPPNSEEMNIKIAGNRTIVYDSELYELQSNSIMILADFLTRIHVKLQVRNHSERIDVSDEDYLKIVHGLPEIIDRIQSFVVR